MMRRLKSLLSVMAYRYIATCHSLRCSQKPLSKFVRSCESVIAIKSLWSHAVLVRVCVQAQCPTLMASYWYCHDLNISLILIHLPVAHVCSQVSVTLLLVRRQVNMVCIMAQTPPHRLPAPSVATLPKTQAASIVSNMV